MQASDVTPLLLTLDEGANLPRTLEALSWAGRIVVIDSGSSDGTLELLKTDPRIVCFHRDFDTHGRQWTYGLSQVETPWVLCLDADHVVTPPVRDEILALEPDSAIAAYAAGFVYCVAGRPIRSGLYPEKPVLLRRARSSFEDDGHTQRPRIDGAIGRLEARLLHDDRKPFSRWLNAQKRYSWLEARKLLETKRSRLRRSDRARRYVPLVPMAVVLQCLIARGGLLDGLPGLVYAAQRAIAETFIQVRLAQLRLSGGKIRGPAAGPDHPNNPDATPERELLG